MMYGEKDISNIFADYIKRIDYSALPHEAVKSAKRSILDTLGVILGASGTVPGINQLVELIKGARGKEEGTILGFGGRVPVWEAAFLNGAMAHGLDYDDLFQYVPSHFGSVTIPAAIAISENLANVDGKTFVTAIVLAQDIMARLVLSLRGTYGWHRTPVMGTFAATAATAKILGLKSEQIVDAFGIAFCQAAGTMELRWGIESDLAGMYPGFPGRTGVLSSLMAARGISGVKRTFEGKGGLFNCYFEGKYDRNVLTAELGKTFQNVTLGFKPWPACGATQGFIDVTLGLVNQYDIKPEDISEIKVFVHDVSRPLTEPIEARRVPPSMLDAKYSIPFTVGLAITKRAIAISDFEESGRKDPEVLAIAQKVSPVYDPSLNIKHASPSVIEIRLKNGKVHGNRVDYPYGHVTRPLSDETLVNKFRDCSLHAARPVPVSNVNQAIELIMNIEMLNDVGKIARLLGPD